MNCTQAQELFDAYLDGELSGSLATEFAAHKLQCPACRRELALLEVTGHVVAADTATPSLSDEFTERLLSCALSAPLPWYRRPATLIKAGSALAAAACLAIVLTLAFSSPASPDPAIDDQPLAPAVAGEQERVESAEQLLENVRGALDRHPGDPRLEALAEQLQEQIEKLATGTKDGAAALENYSRTEIMNILKSIPIDTPQAPAEREADPTAGEDENDPTSAEHH